MAHPTIAHLELGHTGALPTTMEKLATALGIAPHELLGEPEPLRALVLSPPIPPSSLQRDLLALPRLGVCRTQAGLTVEELARSSEVTTKTIVNVERGRESARMTTALKLAHALGVGLFDIMQPQPTVSRLRLARYAAGLTLVELEARSGVMRQAISRIEQGLRPAKLTTLTRLAAALNVRLEDLLDEPARPGRRMVRLVPRGGQA
jgi:transcriptional regulator with XRE-family HTH domain